MGWKFSRQNIFSRLFSQPGDKPCCASLVQGDPSILYSVAINLGSSPGLWAATATSYCPSRPGELPKLIATEYRIQADRSPCMQEAWNKKFGLIVHLPATFWPARCWWGATAGRSPLPTSRCRSTAWSSSSQCPAPYTTPAIWIGSPTWSNYFQSKLHYILLLMKKFILRLLSHCYFTSRFLTSGWNPHENGIVKAVWNTYCD